MSNSKVTEFVSQQKQLVESCNLPAMQGDMADVFTEYTHVYTDGEMGATGKKPLLPAAREMDSSLVRQAIASRLEELHRSEDPSSLVKWLKETREKVQILRARIEAVVELIAEKPNPTVDDCLAESQRLRQIANSGMTKVLTRQSPTETTVRSLALALEEADGRVKGLYYLNHFGVPSETSAEWGEAAMKEWEPEQFEGGQLPILESPQLPDGEYSPVTLTPFSDRLVFQTKPTVFAFVDRFSGLSDLRWACQIAEKANSFAYGHMRTGVIEKKTADFKKLREVILSEFKHVSESFKFGTVFINGEVIRRASKWETADVVISPAFIDLGKRLSNDARSDATLTTPITNPADQRVTARTLGPVARWLARDRNNLYNDLALPTIIEVSDSKASGVWRVFHNGKTAWMGEHSIELQLGENLASSLVAFTLLQEVGRPTTTAQAQRVGQRLNAVLRQRASEKRADRPFLKAECLWEQSHCSRQTVKDADGNEIVDAEGNPQYTGRWEQTHHIKVQYREGTDTFRAIFVS